MREFAFDIKLLATVRLKAASESEARAIVQDCLSYCEPNLGAWPDGSPILCGAGLDGALDLIEIDGESV